jgi:CDP-paratose 2-epimerase
MKILLTGACGFVGATLARGRAEAFPSDTIIGCDNFIRPGSERNRLELKSRGIRLIHADLRSASDVEALPPADWVIDCAANPSVLAGVDGRTSSRQLVEHNLLGTINLLEYCRVHRAGLILLSTSRVYSIAALAGLNVRAEGGAYAPVPTASIPLPPGLSAAGITEEFSNDAPISLYGSTKLASEAMALEYGETYGFPVFINRCGVLAGAGQFGRPDQGIFSYWINRWLQRQPLAYIGFDGQGHQVRDCLHPRDLLPLLASQFAAAPMPVPDRTINVSGGLASARSLRQLSLWCALRLGNHGVASQAQPRPFDLPWVVLSSAKAERLWGWRPTTPVEDIWQEIAAHGMAQPEWLRLSEP